MAGREALGMTLDVSEFPAEYTGRRTYVRTRNYDGVVASCYTYYGYDGRSYLHEDYGGDDSGRVDPSAVKCPYLVRDISHYQSPIDGTMITSRSAHRAHLKQHDLVEVGNERLKTPRPDLGPAKGDIAAAVKQHLEHVKALPQAAYDQHVAQVKATENGWE